jgi:transcriptional regulator with XRE-family HTH domain
MGRKAVRSKRAQGWRAELAAAREAAQLSVTEAAKAAGVSQSYWTEVERGDKTPSLPMLEAMAKAVGRRVVISLKS